MKTQEKIEQYEIDKMPFWRQLAGQLLPDEKDQWHVGEIATALRLTAELLRDNWPVASTICDKSEKAKITLGISVCVDRKETPPSVGVALSFGERIKRLAASEVPNPDQLDLPGVVEDKTEAAE